MPDVKVYIRKDDMEKWAGIPNKAEFVAEALDMYYSSNAPSNALSNALSSNYSTTRQVDVKKKPAPSAPAVPLGQTKTDPLKDLLKTVDTCPHGFAKGFCKRDDCNKKYQGKKK